VSTSQPVQIAARPLSELPAGSTAILHRVNLDAEAHDVLRGVGLTDASLLRVCKSGEPCVVQVHATRIGLSSRVASQILVLVQNEPAAPRS
jgi:Fe2+ transport system protein FeoA